MWLFSPFTYLLKTQYTYANASRTFGQAVNDATPNTEFLPPSENEVAKTTSDIPRLIEWHNFVRATQL